MTTMTITKFEIRDYNTIFIAIIIVIAIIIIIMLIIIIHIIK